MTVGFGEICEGDCRRLLGGPGDGSDCLDEWGLWVNWWLRGAVGDTFSGEGLGRMRWCGCLVRVLAASLEVFFRKICYGKKLLAFFGIKLAFTVRS